MLFLQFSPNRIGRNFQKVIVQHACKSWQMGLSGPRMQLKERGALASSSVYKFYHFICPSLNICVFVRVCSDRNIMRVGSSDYRPACQTGNVRELLMFSDPPSWFWDHSLQAPLSIMMHKKDSLARPQHSNELVCRTGYNCMLQPGHI